MNQAQFEREFPINSIARRDLVEVFGCNSEQVEKLTDEQMVAMAETICDKTIGDADDYFAVAKKIAHEFASGRGKPTRGANSTERQPLAGHVKLAAHPELTTHLHRNRLQHHFGKRLDQLDVQLSYIIETQERLLDAAGVKGPPSEVKE